jgi:hypothetical protein
LEILDPVEIRLLHAAALDVSFLLVEKIAFHSCFTKSLVFGGDRWVLLSGILSTSATNLILSGRQNLAGLQFHPFKEFRLRLPALTLKVFKGG